MLGEEFGILCDRNGNIQSWRFGKDSAPLDNPKFSIRQPEMISVGPSIIMFQPTHHNRDGRVSIKYQNMRGNNL